MQCSDVGAEGRPLDECLRPVLALVHLEDGISGGTARKRSLDGHVLETLHFSTHVQNACLYTEEDSELWQLHACYVKVVGEGPKYAQDRAHECNCILLTHK